jgi:hypothetical protein
VIRIAERVRKILQDLKRWEKDSIVIRDDFPRLLEKDVEKFMKEYTLASPNDYLDRSDIGSIVREENEEDSDCEDGGASSHRDLLEDEDVEDYKQD